MRIVSGEVVEVGVDWLTSIAKSSPAQEACQSIASDLLNRERQLGNDMKPWRFKGYEGFSCGHVQLGTRDDSTCVRLGSVVAATYWRRLYQESESVSRVDLQVTLRPQIEPLKLLGFVHKQALRWSNNRKDTPSVGIRRKNDGGGTVYIGERTSDSMGRAYIKGAESKVEHYAGTFRFEVELKGPMCLPTLRHISGQKLELVAIAGNVSGFFQRRGVNLRLPSVATHTISVHRKRSDNARRLEWLRTQVRPSIDHLIACGCYTEVLEALGLDQQLSKARSDGPEA